MAARRTHIPFVTTYHGLYNSNGRLKRLYNSSCYAATGPSPIPNGRPGHIRNTYGASVKRLIVIPRGIDLTTRPTSRWIAGHARANIGALPKGSAWFCCLGASPAGRASSRSWRRSSEAAAGLKECAPSWLAMRKVVTITSRNSWGDQRKRTEPDRPSVGACRRHGGGLPRQRLARPGGVRAGPSGGPLPRADWNAGVICRPSQSGA
jgi:hypothetical protein